MNNKALYWIGLGVFVLALNSEYRNGGLPVAHRVADRATAVYCQVAVRAEQVVEIAKVIIDGSGQQSADQFVAQQQAEINRVMARHQAELDRALALRQAELDRQVALRQAEFARMQQSLGRMQVVMDGVQFEKLPKLGNFKFNFNDGHGRKTIVVCPETGAKIEVSVPDFGEVQ